MKNYIIKFTSIALLQLLFSAQSKSQIIILHEGFDSLNVNLSNGWEEINKSNPIGAGVWKQGDAFSSGFNSGATSYAQVDYSSVDSLGTISNWLLSDTVSLQNNDTVAFYTLSYHSSLYPDRLECRFSMMGASDSVGTDEFSTGNFSSLLVSVNPYQDSLSYPSVVGSFVNLVHTWKQYKGIVTGLTGITPCRLAFRYFVTNGGLSGTRSSTIGVDELKVTRPIPQGIAENNILSGIKIYPNPAKENINLRIENNGNYFVNIFNSIGQNVLSFKTESSKTIDLSRFSSALYTLQIIDIKTGRSETVHFVKE